MNYSSIQPWVYRTFLGTLKLLVSQWKNMAHQLAHFWSKFYPLWLILTPMNSWVCKKVWFDKKQEVLTWLKITFAGFVACKPEDTADQTVCLGCCWTQECLHFQGKNTTCPLTLFDQVTCMLGKIDFEIPESSALKLPKNWQQVCQHKVSSSQQWLEGFLLKMTSHHTNDHLWQQMTISDHAWSKVTKAQIQKILTF